MNYTSNYETEFKRHRNRTRLLYVKILKKKVVLKKDRESQSKLL